MTIVKKIVSIAIIALVIFAFSGKAKREVIYTEKAPKPIGPYSQATLSEGTLFVSGQIALKTDGTMDTSSIENECRLVLENIKTIVEAAGMKLSNVTKASIFTTDLKQFPKINAVYGSYFTLNPPARETIEVRALPKGAHVEISVIAE